MLALHIHIQNSKNKKLTVDREIHIYSPFIIRYNSCSIGYKYYLKIRVIFLLNVKTECYMRVFLLLVQLVCIRPRYGIHIKFWFFDFFSDSNTIIISVAHIPNHTSNCFNFNCILYITYGAHISFKIYCLLVCHLFYCEKNFFRLFRIQCSTYWFKT